MPCVLQQQKAMATPAPEPEPEPEPEPAPAPKASTSSKAFRHAVMWMSIGIGETHRVRDLIGQALQTAPAERTPEQLERLELYLSQLKLAFLRRPEGPSAALCKAVCTRLTCVRLAPFLKLYSDGDHTHGAGEGAGYVLVDGEVEEVEEGTGPGKEVVVGTLGPGAAVGEAGLDGVRRTLGLRCGAKPATLARLAREDYVELVAEEREREIEAAREFLVALHQLRRLPRDAMSMLAAAVEPVKFERHAVLGVEGEAPDFIVIPRAGDAILSVHAPDVGPGEHAGIRPSEMPVASLALLGEFVGLGALFDDSYDAYRFPCSVVAKVPVEGYRVPRDVAKKCFKSRPVMRALRESHKTRHSLTLDQISRISGVSDPAVTAGASALEVVVSNTGGAPKFVAPPKEVPETAGMADTKWLDGKVTRTRQYPQTQAMSSSMLATSSTPIFINESRSESAIGGRRQSSGQGSRRRPSSAVSSASAARGRALLLGGASGHGAGYHAAAFRVTNDFVARSDGVLQHGTVTTISGFSVANDTITLTVKRSNTRRKSTIGRPNSAVGRTPQVMVLHSEAAGISGSWHVDLPQPRFSCSSYTIEVTSARTGGRAEFVNIRWGEISKGLGDGLEIHSRLPLRYAGHALPKGAVALEQARRRDAVGKESSLGSLSGMVTNLPDLDAGKVKYKRAASEAAMLRMLEIPVAGNTLEMKAGAKGPKVYGRFPLDAYAYASAGQG